MPIYPREFIDSFLPGGGRSNCFVLMPFISSFDGVYESIRRACESSEVLLSCSRADDFYGAGHIMEDILRGIMASEYVVADLTGRNPNVFYELGIAHSSKAATKVVIISRRASIMFHLICGTCGASSTGTIQRGFAVLAKILSALSFRIPRMYTGP